MTVVFSGTVSAPLGQLPARTALAAPAPNPFRQATRLEFALAQPGRVELAIYGVDGRRLRTLVSEAREAGIFRMEWDGRDDHGGIVKPGVYYARLATHQGSFTRAIVRLR